jgi:hypothetical protein
MNKKRKRVPKLLSKRNLFKELTEGTIALAALRQQKPIPSASRRKA